MELYVPFGRIIFVPMKKNLIFAFFIFPSFLASFLGLHAGFLAIQTGNASENNAAVGNAGGSALNSPVGADTSLGTGEDLPLSQPDFHFSRRHLDCSPKRLVRTATLSADARWESASAAYSSHHSHPGRHTNYFPGLVRQLTRRGTSCCPAFRCRFPARGAPGRRGDEFHFGTARQARQAIHFS